MLQIMPLLLWVVVSQTNFGHASLSSANTFTARTTFNITSSVTLPSGTTAQDGSPAVGMITP